MNVYPKIPFTHLSPPITLSFLDPVRRAFASFHFMELELQVGNGVVDFLDCSFRWLHRQVTILHVGK